MATYQRGKYWWYRFRFARERIDEPTKSTSRTVAKEAERQHRRALEAGYNNFKEIRQNRVRILEEIIGDYAPIDEPHSPLSQPRLDFL